MAAQESFVTVNSRSLVFLLPCLSLSGLLDVLCLNDVVSKCTPCQSRVVGSWSLSCKSTSAAYPLGQLGHFTMSAPLL